MGTNPVGLKPDPQEGAALVGLKPDPQGLEPEPQLQTPNPGPQGPRTRLLLDLQTFHAPPTFDAP